MSQRLIILLIPTVACLADQPQADTPDATVGGDGGGAAITGHLCLVNDLRYPSTCAEGADLANVPLVIGGVATESTATGTFAVAAAGGEQLQILVGQGDIRYRASLSVAPLIDGSAAELSIPIVSAQTWQSLLSTVGVAEPDDTATLLTYISNAQGEPVVGANILPPTGTNTLPLYAGDSGRNDWDVGRATNDSGAVLVIGIPSDAETTKFTVFSTATSYDQNVPVAADALTFHYAVLP